MTAYTDRAAALKAAIQDIARDLEADLEKLTRYRGSSSPSTSTPTFKDPGPDLDSYAKQKTTGGEHATLRKYRGLTEGARNAFSGKPDSWGVGGGVALTGAAASELLALLREIESIQSHADAAALVATFEQV